MDYAYVMVHLSPDEVKYQVSQANQSLFNAPIGIDLNILRLPDLFGKSHVVRFGGEEFVVGLWVQDEEDLRKKLHMPYERITIRKFSTQQIDTPSPSAAAGAPGQI